MIIVNLPAIQICVHCNTDPGTKKGSDTVWNGFKDGDTLQFVCNKCKKVHYQKKFAIKELRGLYTEFPVTVIQSSL